jgi:hypothetical protein
MRRPFGSWYDLPTAGAFKGLEVIYYRLVALPRQTSENPVKRSDWEQACIQKVSHHRASGATLTFVPTTHPRYTVTDTGSLREMLDLAHRRWPEVQDRRQLLLRLAGVGADRVASELSEADAGLRRARQSRALSRASELVDTELLLTDQAWQ